MHDTAGDSLLEVRDLRTTFTVDGCVLPAVDGVSLVVPRGRTVALVGESGCGKSVASLSIMRLIPQPPGNITGGEILFRPAPGSPGLNLLDLAERDMRRIRGGRIAMIFQEPMTSLNPVYSVGSQIVEAIELHSALRGKKAWTTAVEMMRRVGVPAPERRARDYPHQLSGGLRQRVMIAMALSCNPALLIADEPTTALDVTVQAQILDLLRTLQNRTRMSVLLITHDLGVVAEIADYVYVMYAGRIVEHAPVADLFARPLHPYTRGLMACSSGLSRQTSRLPVIAGQVPDPVSYPSGCRFHPRCPLTAEGARVPDKASIAVESSLTGRVLRRCVEHHADETSGTPRLRELHRDHFVACWEAGAPAAAPAGLSQSASHPIVAGSPGDTGREMGRS
jgi:oligopeptide transport system ATP-binding protein